MIYDVFNSFILIAYVMLNEYKGLMSAPASLAIAKTLFPETKKTRADWNAIANVKSK